MIMPVEPGMADTNVLVYALDVDAPQHAAARELLEAARDASTTLFVTPQILCEFYIRSSPIRGALPSRAPRPRP
jgi:predicted nucleic acid-binding protein